MRQAEWCYCPWGKDNKAEKAGEKCRILWGFLILNCQLGTHEIRDKLKPEADRNSKAVAVKSRSAAKQVNFCGQEQYANRLRRRWKK